MEELSAKAATFLITRIFVHGWARIKPRIIFDLNWVRLVDEHSLNTRIIINSVRKLSHFGDQSERQNNVHDPQHQIRLRRTQGEDQVVL